MQYNPKDASNCWPDGDYDATLTKVEDGVSKKSGNEMQTWTFEVYHNDGRKQIISDYVTVPACTFKIKQLAIAMGQKAEFEAGTFDASNYINSGVIVALITEESDGFDDKNRIKKVKPAGAKVELPTSSPRPSVSNNPISAARPQRQAVTSPIGSDEQFKEEDIPF